MIYPNRPATSVFDGVDELIGERFDSWGVDRRYRSKTACKDLNSRPAFNAEGAEMLLRQVLNQVRSNLASLAVRREPSRENWRFEKKLWMANHASSPEKILEKSIAQVAGDAWTNQMPTASGLVTASADRSRNIDLVFERAPRCFEFIELKVRSDTPCYAAMEILKSSLLYILARSDSSSLHDRNSRILTAEAVHFRVLAPCEFYKGYKLAWFEAALSSGIQRVADGIFRTGFAFNAFPNGFAPDCGQEQLRFALTNREPVDWSA